MLRGGESSPQLESHLAAHFLELVSEHLIPIWSYGRLPRFRLGGEFHCPSRESPLDQLCPAKSICSGTFPGIANLPASCWFQEMSQKILNLRVNRIGIVPGEYGSETEVQEHETLWGPFPEDSPDEIRLINMLQRGIADRQ